MSSIESFEDNLYFGKSTSSEDVALPNTTNSTSLRGLTGLRGSRHRNANLQDMSLPTMSPESVSSFSLMTPQYSLPAHAGNVLIPTYDDAVLYNQSSQISQYKPNDLLKCTNISGVLNNNPGRFLPLQPNTMAYSPKKASEVSPDLSSSELYGSDEVLSPTAQHVPSSTSSSVAEERISFSAYNSSGFHQNINSSQPTSLPAPNSTVGVYDTGIVPLATTNVAYLCQQPAPVSQGSDITSQYPENNADGLAPLQVFPSTNPLPPVGSTIDTLGYTAEIPPPPLPPPQLDLLHSSMAVHHLPPLSIFPPVGALLPPLGDIDIRTVNAATTTWQPLSHSPTHTAHAAPPPHTGHIGESAHATQADTATRNIGPSNSGFLNSEIAFPSPSALAILPPLFPEPYSELHSTKPPCGEFPDTVGAQTYAHILTSPEAAADITLAPTTNSVVAAAASTAVPVAACVMAGARADVPDAATVAGTCAAPDVALAVCSTFASAALAPDTTPSTTAVSLFPPLGPPLAHTHTHTHAPLTSVSAVTTTAATAALALTPLRPSSRSQVVHNAGTHTTTHVSSSESVNTAAPHATSSLTSSPMPHPPSRTPSRTLSRTDTSTPAVTSGPSVRWADAVEMRTYDTEEDPVAAHTSTAAGAVTAGAAAAYQTPLRSAHPSMDAAYSPLRSDASDGSPLRGDPAQASKLRSDSSNGSPLRSDLAQALDATAVLPAPRLGKLLAVYQSQQHPGKESGSSVSSAHPALPPVVASGMPLAGKSLTDGKTTGISSAEAGATTSADASVGASADAAALQSSSTATASKAVQSRRGRRRNKGCFSLYRLVGGVEDDADDADTEMDAVLGAPTPGSAAPLASGHAMPGRGAEGVRGGGAGHGMHSHGRGSDAYSDGHEEEMEEEEEEEVFGYGFFEVRVKKKKKKAVVDTQLPSHPTASLGRTLSSEAPRDNISTHAHTRGDGAVSGAGCDVGGGYADSVDGGKGAVASVSILDLLMRRAPAHNPNAVATNTTNGTSVVSTCTSSAASAASGSHHSRPVVLTAPQPSPSTTTRSLRSPVFPPPLSTSFSTASTHGSSVAACGNEEDHSDQSDHSTVAAAHSFTVRVSRSLIQNPQTEGVPDRIAEYSLGNNVFPLSSTTRANSNVDSTSTHSHTTATGTGMGLGAGMGTPAIGSPCSSSQPNTTRLSGSMARVSLEQSVIHDHYACDGARASHHQPLPPIHRSTHTSPSQMPSRRDSAAVHQTPARASPHIHTHTLAHAQPSSRRSSTSAPREGSLREAAPESVPRAYSRWGLLGTGVYRGTQLLRGVWWGNSGRERRASAGAGSVPTSGNGSGSGGGHAGSVGGTGEGYSLGRSHPNTPTISHTTVTSTIASPGVPTTHRAHTAACTTTSAMTLAHATTHTGTHITLVPGAVTLPPLASPERRSSNADAMSGRFSGNTAVNARNTPAHPPSSGSSSVSTAACPVCHLPFALDTTAVHAAGVVSTQATQTSTNSLAAAPDSLTSHTTHTAHTVSTTAAMHTSPAVPAAPVEPVVKPSGISRLLRLAGLARTPTQAPVPVPTPIPTPAPASTDALTARYCCCPRTDATAAAANTVAVVNPSHAVAATTTATTAAPVAVSAAFTAPGTATPAAGVTDMAPPVTLAQLQQTFGGPVDSLPTHSRSSATTANVIIPTRLATTTAAPYAGASLPALAPTVNALASNTHYTTEVTNTHTLTTPLTPAPTAFAPPPMPVPKSVAVPVLVPAPSPPSTQAPDTFTRVRQLVMQRQGSLHQQPNGALLGTPDTVPGLVGNHDHHAEACPTDSTAVATSIAYPTPAGTDMPAIPSPYTAVAESGAYDPVPFVNVADKPVGETVEAAILTNPAVISKNVNTTASTDNHTIVNSSALNTAHTDTSFDSPALACPNTSPAAAVSQEDVAEALACSPPLQKGRFFVLTSLVGDGIEAMAATHADSAIPDTTTPDAASSSAAVENTHIAVSVDPGGALATIEPSPALITSDVTDTPRANTSATVAAIASAASIRMPPLPFTTLSEDGDTFKDCELPHLPLPQVVHTNVRRTVISSADVQENKFPGAKTMMPGRTDIEDSPFVFGMYGTKGSSPSSFGKNEETPDFEKFRTGLLSRLPLPPYVSSRSDTAMDTPTLKASNVHFVGTTLPHAATTIFTSVPAPVSFASSSNPSSFSSSLAIPFPTACATDSVESSSSSTGHRPLGFTPLDLYECPPSPIPIPKCAPVAAVAEKKTKKHRRPRKDGTTGVRTNVGMGGTGVGADVNVVGDMGTGVYSPVNQSKPQQQLQSHQLSLLHIASGTTGSAPPTAATLKSTGFANAAASTTVAEVKKNLERASTLTLSLLSGHQDACNSRMTDHIRLPGAVLSTATAATSTLFGANGFSLNPTMVSDIAAEVSNNAGLAVSTGGVGVSMGVAVSDANSCAPVDDGSLPSADDSIDLTVAAEEMWHAPHHPRAREDVAALWMPVPRRSGDTVGTAAARDALMSYGLGNVKY